MRFFYSVFPQHSTAFLQDSSQNWDEVTDTHQGSSFLRGPVRWHVESGPTKGVALMKSKLHNQPCPVIGSRPIIRMNSNKSILPEPSSSAKNLVVACWDCFTIFDSSRGPGIPSLQLNILLSQSLSWCSIFLSYMSCLTQYQVSSSLTYHMAVGTTKKHCVRGKWRPENGGSPLGCSFSPQPPQAARLPHQSRMSWSLFMLGSNLRASERKLHHPTMVGLVSWTMYSSLSYLQSLGF